MSHRSAPHIATGRGWTMHLGDCLEIMPTLDRVAHVITDPPYEVEAHTKARRHLCDATQKRGARNTGKVRRIDQPLEIDFAAITEEERTRAASLFAGVASRWVIAFCQIEAVAAWRAALVTGGLQWVRGGVWRKPDGAPQFTGDRPGQGFECLSITSNDDDCEECVALAITHPKGRKRWNGGGRHAFWQFSLEHAHGAGGRNEHGTQKPVPLMLALVADFTDEDETVLDAYAGSGTTGVACLRLGRKFVGIERSPKHFAYAVERLRAEENGTTVHAARAQQGALFGGAP